MINLLDQVFPCFITQLRKTALVMNENPFLLSKPAKLITPPWPCHLLTLMLQVASLKKKKPENGWIHGTWVLISEKLSKVYQQNRGLDGFLKNPFVLVLWTKEALLGLTPQGKSENKYVTIWANTPFSLKRQIYLKFKRCVYIHLLSSEPTIGTAIGQRIRKS